MRPLRLPLVLAAVLGLAGCAGTRPEPPTPQPERPAYPGFDTWRYPGDATMRTWRERSPYRWVGYYLPAPCRRDTSWAGRRGALAAMGWGTAVLYVGQQTFEGEPPPDTTAGTPIVCSRTLLTAEQGQRDARDAIRATLTDGFPAGTTIFLDVEPMRAIPLAWTAYYRAWLDEVLRDGRFRPGTYVHRESATALFTTARAAYAAAGQPERPPFWIAGGSGFTLESAPDASGFPFADAWQGRLDVERTWGDVSLSIDENVARRPDPSAPPPTP